MGEEDQPSIQAASCSCFNSPGNFLVTDAELGMDAHFAQVTLLVCPRCGQLWLRYLYEVEAFTASGRWYLGAIDAKQAKLLTAEKAKVILENLRWYFYGGSFYAGRKGRGSGSINLSL